MGTAMNTLPLVDSWKLDSSWLAAKSIDFGTDKGRQLARRSLINGTPNLLNKHPHVLILIDCLRNNQVHHITRLESKMKQRITYLRDNADDFNPSQLEVGSDYMLVRSLKAAKEHRLTVGLEELPKEVRCSPDLALSFE